MAHVPPMNQLPSLIRQPSVEPELVTTLRKPLPEKEPVGAGDPGLVVVGLGAVPPPDFGRYFMPVEGQSEFEPTAQLVLGKGSYHRANTEGKDRAYLD